MKATQAALLVFVTGLAFAEPRPEDVLRANLEERIETIIAGVDGVVGVTIKDLTTDETLSVNGDMVFTQASSIKLPTLVELFRQVEERKWALDEPVTMGEADVTSGSGVMKALSPGRVTMPLRDVATLMITVSDNTATNMIIDRVGMDDVTRTMAGLELTHTKLQRKMMDTDAWMADRENLSTPNEQARLLELLHEGEILGDASREEIFRILSIPKSSHIRRLLPPGTRVAHKTGGVSGVVVDVGIVYLPERPFIVSAMTNWLVDEDEGSRAISEISLAAYQYFDRLENSNSYGHKK